MQDIHPQQATVDRILAQIEAEEAITLEGDDGFYLYMERPLPYLVVYRLPERGDDHIRFKLDRTEASYLIAPSRIGDELYEVFKCLVKALSDRFGSVLLLEIWTAAMKSTESRHPKVRIIGPAESLPGTMDVLEKELSRIEFSFGRLAVEVDTSKERYPEGYQPLLRLEDSRAMEVLILGLEIQPFYINPDTEQPYPVYLRLFRNQLSVALKKAFFDFIRLQTTYEVPHFHILGTTQVDEIVWEVDEQLVRISNFFRFLFLVTPINADEAWEQFLENRYSKDPVFHYRLMPMDPDQVKRDLFNIPIEKVSDPTLSYLFRDKRDELEKMLTMLSDRATPDFLYSSMQVYGTVDESLLDLAQGLLTAIPVSYEKGDEEEAMPVDARSFAARAEEELQFLRQQYPPMQSGVVVRSDVSGIMVSEGVLYISDNYKMRRERVEALIQHEIGTHVLTYWNAKAQPLKQLFSGVPGYEELQEGLAVLTEYLVDGLTNERLRVLAARVVGVHRMVNGASFCETFNLLHHKYQFPPRKAFYITMRIYRGGGLTKDAVYLRGLHSLLQYLRTGNELEPLLIGKIREDYIPIIQELIHRGILNPVPMKPRYLLEETDALHTKMTKLRQGLSVFNLINDFR